MAGHPILRTVAHALLPVRSLLAMMRAMILQTIPVGPLQCNCSILGDEETGTAIVIDPGDEAERVAEAVKKLGLTVTHIVHTHAHIDHIGGSAEFKRLCGGKALLHEGDQWLYEHLDMQGQMVGMSVTEAVALDAKLEEGDRFDLGHDKLEVLHTPGHSPGSCTFVIERDGRQLVFAGDTLFAGSIGRTDLWGGNSEEILSSLRGKLMELDDDAEVITGHGASTTIGAERRNNPFITGQYRI
jgi:glyoxylase-like metal-dependent hydrolase (beta-lactamase superfamily II)